MNAESLIGTVLGTCTLKKIIGQGGMGAVFLAQQSRPRRQVAVKVLLPMTSLTPNQLAAFLERFRRETDAAASLEHPNIMPVYEYGERDGLAYLVMPYISGGTLRDEMDGNGQLALPKVMNYLDQLGAALDYAHERGVIHRDVKPANILITREGRLLLTDFGLAKVVTEGQTPQMRLTGAGAPVGTPDYMAPEQVMGDHVDSRADLYSLGVILYHMVTGTTPFQGETPMQIAAQHLQTPPPSPRLLRARLPFAIEQVMLGALAKRPADRYAYAQDLAAAFRAASTGMQPDSRQSGLLSSTGNTAAGLFAPQARGLFDPAWQTGTLPSAGSDLGKSRQTGALPAANADAARSTGLLSRTGKFPQMGGTGQFPATPATPPNNAPLASMATLAGTQPALLPPGLGQLSPMLKTTTGALMVPSTEQSTTGTMKLTGPVKLVQVPVAGQPGRYVTGLLPVVSQPTEATETTAPAKGGPKKRLKMVALIAAVLLLLFGTGGGAFWFVHTHNGQTAQTKSGASTTIVGTPNAKTIAAAHATATAEANVILSDPLSQNIHNWQTTPSDVYAFKNGAYHITDRGSKGTATVLQESPFTGSIGYILTMEEITGNDASPNNSFGMIFRFNQQTKGSQVITTFYSFEVVNTKGGEYQFWKYDDSKGSAVSPWTEIWHQPFGSEFHQGHGPQSVNTIKVFMNGKSFTFTVNGKKITAAQDGSFASGTVGMLVNLNGTEVAFSNMLITHT